MTYGKPVIRLARNAPHRVAVTFIARTAWGADRDSKVLPDVYPTWKVAMAAAHEIVKSGGYMEAIPVAC